ncbi:hypothetical protein LPJ78_004532 [Coemansia sp. RSA 989]|nr:kinase-like domain-containing protein [Coemansia mojavensis]KAJ1740189.1 hypothetical protein LPJ68_003979 [Coemansia sp. RSA 1086]KAJ1752433.1 hypothetical protein LPJ79_001180 [Coemansia sp. RSA 1821]KAJ1862697.1 hypothetical protein LPJ78_004532 [Coemansia sp. RSA 989]KAJ1874577.1 hypothetical protein LPJ55_001437 [Coemansia sp. RSA 990]KAJ2648578.1 hypothetical protein IWW40_003764 [Coemansia sp. RSA 1250]KAJ2673277.1 hypothetical protein IWW42_002287 [Coemansia sp. RSA 1085]
MGNSMAKQQPEPGLGLHKFRLLRVIGRGSFGKVRIVEHRTTGKTYALKYINKATCISMKAHANTLRERDILEEIDHPFIVNLRFSFQDDSAMFMAMDLMIGGDLRFHIMRRRFFEGVIKFWIAELACAVHHLHAIHHIVHRDIKPDNILMDSEGHVALTDFNIATRIVDRVPHYAVAGTANYMAPEIVSGTGYTYSVDWWSLGVVMYECVYGRRPFRHKKNTDSLRRALLYEEIQFPLVADVQVSYDCISALRGLLTKDPVSRLGCGPAGYDALKAHPFFASIDWAKLESRQLTPPFVPNNDMSNFDISHDLEEMLLDPEPLQDSSRRKPAAKRAKTPPEHDTPEYRHIAEHFADFDYIEYEQFKAYLDVHGSISALAMEDARAASVGTLEADASLSSSLSLARIKLDDRPIINLEMQSTLSYSVTLSRSRTVLQQQQSIIANSPDVSLAEAAGASQTPPSLRQRISEARRRGSSGTRDRRPSDARQQTDGVFSSATNSSCATMATPAAEQASNMLHPGTLEPPSIVPIDILTWNQLLPSQRSLAHRYCIKMAHDRLRRSAARSQRQPATTKPPLHFPKLAERSNHRYTPSASARVQCGSVEPSDLAGSSSSKASLRKRSSAELLTAKEKRTSLIKRQLSVDNVAGLQSKKASEYLPLDVNVRDFALDMTPYLEQSRNSTRNSFDQSQHYYQTQPLPPPPSSAAVPFDIVESAVKATNSHLNLLSDAPQCPLPPPPSQTSLT